MNLAGTGESSLIELIRRLQPPCAEDVRLGIGDDAAVLEVQGGRLLASCDMLVEGIHFDPATTTTFQLGYKSITVNLSDIYAMGGLPRHLLVSLAMPPSMSLSDFESLVRGMLTAAERYDTDIVGGDTCRSAGGLVISVSVTGMAERPVLRSGARPGQGVFVSGTLGESAAGLEVLKKTGQRTNLQETDVLNIPFVADHPDLAGSVVRVLKAHLMPDPVISPFPEAAAMIDISDGLLLDLTRLCDASSVGVRLEADRVPVSEDVRRLAPHLGIPALEMALQGGEDYKLLFAAADGRKYKNAVQVGLFTDGPRTLISEKGEEKPLEPSGYDHFRQAG